MIAPNKFLSFQVETRSQSPSETPSSLPAVARVSIEINVLEAIMLALAMQFTPFLLANAFAVFCVIRLVYPTDNSILFGFVLSFLPLRWVLVACACQVVHEATRARTVLTHRILGVAVGTMLFLFARGIEYQLDPSKRPAWFKRQ